MPRRNFEDYRLVKIAEEILSGAAVEVDLLDLSTLTSEYGRKIHPCKGCVSTAMPLCHWPCSCYPNHSLGQADDWMAEIYPRWTAAHGILIVTPVYWYQVPSTLKLMMDRSYARTAAIPIRPPRRARIRRKPRIWSSRARLSQHLAGRVYGVVVHGDVAGIETVRRALWDWLDWMGLIDAGPQARLDRWSAITSRTHSSHQALDEDTAFQEEVRNVARALARGIGERRAGRLNRPVRISRARGQSDCAGTADSQFLHAFRTGCGIFRAGLKSLERGVSRAVLNVPELISP